ncbi:unnamed protein product, partial [Clonostachys solani]
MMGAHAMENPPVMDLGFSLRESLIKSGRWLANATDRVKPYNEQDQDDDGDDVIFDHLCLSDGKVNENELTPYEFLPLSSLEFLFSLGRTKKIIAKAFPHENHQYLLAQICGNSYKRSRIRILAVLCQMKRPQLIKSFLQHKVFDDSLPLDKQLSKFEWEKKDLFDFRDKQYKALAPFFHLNAGKLRHYCLNSKIQIPFLSRRAIGSGAHGAVSKICLHEDHYFWEENNDFDLTGPYFSLKEFNSGMASEFLNERKALERFSGSHSGHPHLIRLLMSYEIDKHYFMIFPLAKYDMLEFWKKVTNNPTSDKFLDWVLTQCYGLARGLQKIHKHDATFEEQSDKYMGRHGDIKPRNILCFDSPAEDGTDDHRDVPRYRLVLADFTFMRFHSPLSCEHSTESAMRYTHTYRPPETYSNHGNIFSQKHDVWTLGCVYLEFITWHLLGHDAIDERFCTEEDGQVRELQGFRTLRNLEDAGDGRFLEDAFFNRDENNQAYLKKSVPKWCSYLRERRSCSPQLYNFINFIQKHMLVVELGERERIDVTRRLLEDARRVSKGSYAAGSIEDKSTKKAFKDHILKGNRISERSNDMPAKDINIEGEDNRADAKSIEQPAVSAKSLMADQETPPEPSLVNSLHITQAKESEKHSAENSNILYKDNSADSKSIEQLVMSKGLLVPGQQTSLKPSSFGSLHSTQVEEDEKNSTKPQRPLSSDQNSMERASQSSHNEKRRNWIFRRLSKSKKHVKKWWFKFKVSTERR